MARGTWTLAFASLLLVSCGFVDLSEIVLFSSDGKGGVAVLVSRITGMRDVTHAPCTVGDAVYFIASPGPTLGQSRFEVWRSDGTGAGTRRVTAIPWSDRRSSPGHFPTETAATDRLFFFVINDGVGGDRLWVSDGTPGGTRELMQASPSTSIYSTFKSLTGVGHSLFFVLNRSGRLQLWRSDGTPKGTIRLRDLAGEENESAELVGLGQRLAFMSRQDLGTSDGTPEGTRIVKTLPRGIAQEPFAPEYAELDGALFIPTSDGLWRTDGSSEGTRRLADVPDGGHHPTRAGRLVFFLSGAAPTKLELWRSDGTPRGTFRVKDVNPRATDSGGAGFPALAGVGDALLFVSADEAHGYELWKSDGTADGTARLTDLCPGPCSSSPRYFVPAAGHLFFQADGPETHVPNTPGREGGLYRTDGTAARTVLVKDQAYFNDYTGAAGKIWTELLPIG